MGDRDIHVAGEASRLLDPFVAIALPALLEAIRARSSRARYWAMGPLGRAGRGEQVVTALVRGLSDRRADVRWAAARAFLDLGPEGRAAAAALEKATRDRSRRVRQMARSALAAVRTSAAAQ